MCYLMFAVFWLLRIGWRLLRFTVNCVLLCVDCCVLLLLFECCLMCVVWCRLLFVVCNMFVVWWLLCVGCCLSTGVYKLLRVV